MNKQKQIRLGIMMPRAKNTTYANSQTWRNMLLQVGNNFAQRRGLLDSYGLLPFLVSGENRAASATSLSLDFSELDRQLNSSDGKVRRVTRRFLPRYKSDDNAELSFNRCEKGGQKQNYKVDEIAISKEFTTVPLLIETKDLLCLPEDLSTHVAQRFANWVADFETSLSIAVGKDIATGGYIGGWAGQYEPSPGTPVSVPLFGTYNGVNAVNPIGYATIDELLRQTGVGNREKVLIGGTKVTTYEMIAGIRSANTPAGLGAAANGLRTIRDVNIGKKLGDPDLALLLTPGALQVAFANYYKGDFMQALEARPGLPQYISFPSPLMDGVTYDMAVTVEEDCSTRQPTYNWTFKLFAYYEIVGVPGCVSNDPCLAGVTDVHKVKIVCDNSTACAIPNDCCDYDATSQPFNSTDCTLDTCVTACMAAYNASKAKLTTFSATGTTAELVSGVKINGVITNFSAAYDLTVAGNIPLVKAQLQAALGTNGTVIVANTGWTFTILAAANVSEIQFVAGDGTPITFTKGAAADYCILESYAIPSTGATVSTIAWAIGAVNIAAGAPSAQLPTTTGIFGTYGKVFVQKTVSTVAANAVVTMTMVDSVACTNALTGEKVIY